MKLKNALLGFMLVTSLGACGAGESSSCEKMAADYNEIVILGLQTTMEQLQQEDKQAGKATYLKTKAAAQSYLKRYEKLIEKDTCRFHGVEAEVEGGSFTKIEVWNDGDSVGAGPVFGSEFVRSAINALFDSSIDDAIEALANIN